MGPVATAARPGGTIGGMPRFFPHPRRVVVHAALLLALGLVSSVAVAWAGGLFCRLKWPAVPLVTTLGVDTPGFRTYRVDPWHVAELRDTTTTRRIGIAGGDSLIRDPLREFYGGRTWDGLAELRDMTPDDPNALPAWSLAHGPVVPPAPPAGLIWADLPTFVERASGWPMRCLRVRWIAGDPTLDLPGERVRGGLYADPWYLPEWGYQYTGSLDYSQRFSMYEFDMERANALPLTPLWGPLVLNTLAWAAFWAITLAIAFLPLRWWARARARRRVRRGRCGHCKYPHEPGEDPRTTCPECGVVLGRVPGLWRCGTGGAIVLPAVTLALLTLATLGFAFQRVFEADRLPTLHTAAALGQSQVVADELARGADPDAEAPFVPSVSPAMQEQRPLAWAAARGHAETVREMLAGGADPTAWSQAMGPMMLAAAYGHDEVVDVLLAAAPPHAMEAAIGQAMFAAVANNDRQMLEKLLAVLPAPGLLAIALALPNRDREIQDRVLSVATHTPDVLAAAARNAIRLGDVDLLGRLLDMGVDARAHSMILLFEALASDRSALVLGLLLDAGADPLVRTHSGFTMLHGWAHSNSDLAVLPILLGRGLDINARDDAGQTALHVAARRASGEHVRALIEAGADASVRDSEGRSARDLWWHRGHGHLGPTPTEDFHRIRELLRVAEPG